MHFSHHKSFNFHIVSKFGVSSLSLPGDMSYFLAQVLKLLKETVTNLILVLFVKVPENYVLYLLNYQADHVLKDITRSISNLI